MRNVFIAAHHILSPLGSGTAVNFNAVLKRMSGVKKHMVESLDHEAAWVSLFDIGQVEEMQKFNTNSFTKYELMLISSISAALGNCDVDVKHPGTLFIISTTKGSISLLESEHPGKELFNRMSPAYSARLVAQYFGNPNEPVVVSNACISGVMAIIYASRMISTGRYNHVVVAGADTITRFVYSGFKSFMALSAEHCRPFSEDRDGINLGEAAGTVVLSTGNHGKGRIGAGSVSNDANHISGPSKTGFELGMAISDSLERSGITQAGIGFISAHGTATLYNDEMEAKAFYHVNLHKVPVNSMKGNFGHTLGAAGIIESVISLQSLEHGVVVPTLGFTTNGVTVPVNVCTEAIEKEMQYCLKTASGFGGCNAALVLAKN